MTWYRPSGPGPTVGGSDTGRRLRRRHGVHVPVASSLESIDTCPSLLTRCCPGAHRRAPGNGEAGEVVMAGPLLETKFHIPRRGRGLVPRRRLIERLSRRAESALTLVSAPAGFGKTTLLTEWLDEWLGAAPAEGRSAAWLSLDPRDNDPALFWRYLVAALEAAAPGVGSGALGLLQSSQRPIEAMLATLLNDLNAVRDDVVLVLDDFHLIEAREVQDGMAFLLAHLPAQIRLVIAGRADPALP